MYGIMHPDSLGRAPLPPLPVPGRRDVRNIRNIHRRNRGDESPRSQIPRGGTRYAEHSSSQLNSSRLEGSGRGDSTSPRKSPQAFDGDDKKRQRAFDFQDAKVAAVLQNLKGDGDEIRRDVNELQRRDFELRARAHNAWNEQRERVEATRQEYGAALTELRHELRSRLEAAEQKQKEFVLQDRSSAESL